MGSVSLRSIIFFNSLYSLVTVVLISLLKSSRYIYNLSPLEVAVCLIVSAPIYIVSKEVTIF